MRVLCTLGLLAALGACATTGMQASYVAPLSSDNDEDVVASDIAAFVADQMPAGTAKVVVYPAPGNDTLVPKLLPALQAQGLVIEAGKNASPPMCTSSVIRSIRSSKANWCGLSSIEALPRNF